MIYVATCSGKNHTISEDAVLVGQELLSETSDNLPFPLKGFVCVADGVGGNHGGAQASHFVLEALVEANDIQPDALKECLEKINDRLIACAKEDPEAASMATTLTGVFADDGAFYLFHIGNTRAFVKQGNYLKQITSDHTTYNWLKSAGQIEAAEVCNKNEITNCFGGGDSNLLSKLYISEIQPFSLMVLTSDGVHEHIDIDTLEDMLCREGPYDEKCQEILSKAIENGSEDDLSIVILCPEE